MASSHGDVSHHATQREMRLRQLHAVNMDAPVLETAGDEEEDEEHQEINLRAMLYSRFLVKCQKLQTSIFFVGKCTSLL